MATIEKRTLKDGTVRYGVRVLIREGRDGRQSTVSGTFDTRAEAEAWGLDREAEKKRGTLREASREETGEYVRMWLENAKKGAVRERTWRDYSLTVERYVENAPDDAPDIGRIRLDGLRPEDLQALYGWMMRKRGLSAASVRSVHAVLRQALDYAVRTGRINRNPADVVTLPRIEKREVTALSEAQLHRYLEAAREDRYAALWFLLPLSGLRPGEALGLKWEDLDLDQSKLQVQRSLTRVRRKEGRDRTWKLTPPKTNRARRTVVLPEQAVVALRTWKAEQARERLKAGSDYENHGFVFTTETGRPLDWTNLPRHFNRVMERAELGTYEVPQPGKPAGRPGPPKRRPFKPSMRVYDLRHTCATLLLREGVNPKIVSERLGHASVAFTMDTYAASMPDMQGEAADAFDQLLGRAEGGA